MAGLVDALVSLLQKEAENCENLLALALEKKDVIVANDTEALQKITALENRIVGRNARLEKERQALVSDIAAVLNADVETLTLGALLQRIEGTPEHAALAAVRDRLRAAAGDLIAANNQNRLLVENALDYIDFSMNMLSGAASDEASYLPFKGDAITANHMFFDARQ